MNHKRFILYIVISLTLATCGAPNTIINVPCGDVNKLKDAINTANQNPGLHTIELAQGCSYQLTSVDNNTEGNNGLPVITSQIVINGNGATILRSVNEPRFRLINVAASNVAAPGNLTLNDLTLENGHADGNGPSQFKTKGGAILNSGHLVVNNTLITENFAEAYAGAIHNSGSMEITKSTISHNDANNLTGGIWTYGGNVIISHSTISENSVGNMHDAIWNSSYMEIFNSTISGNGGNGIDNEGQLTLEFVTLANNGLAAINSVSGSITMKNTLFGPNTPYSCSLGIPVNTQGVNMDTDGSCNITTVSPNSLQLGPLADNGGPTKTHALPAGSVAIDAATGNCPSTDQRGVHRPQGSSCDIGAYEYDGEFPQSTSTGTTAPESRSIPTQTPTSTYSRCPRFDSDAMSLITFDVPVSSTKFSLYVKNSEGWPGLEFELPGDTEDWVYTAFLGGTEADECSFQGYAGRLYCDFILPAHMLNTNQVLKVFVNLCDPPIYVHERVSIISPGETPTACRSDLNQTDCEAAGGTHSCIVTCTCDCGP